MVLTETSVTNNSSIKHVTSPALNYYRLARLTLVEGTKQVRECVLEWLPEGHSLHSALDKCRKKLVDLYSRRIISDKQWRLLFPDGSNVDPARIDLTLWIILLRNVARLGVRNINWNEAPSANETEWYHDVLRIRETRNSLAHLLRPELDDDSFENLWNYVVMALRRLNWYVVNHVRIHDGWCVVCVSQSMNEWMNEFI